MCSTNKEIKIGYVKPDCNEITVVLQSMIAQSQRSATEPEGWDVDDDEFKW